MAFIPTLTNLGSVNENVSISHTITYEEEDPVTLTMTSYPVTITAVEVNPDTIVISGDTISGYYQDSFNNTITYRTPEGTFPIVTKFNEIDLNKLDEMISYKASTSTSRVFTYTATAKDGVTPVATQTYTKTVTNNWTSGKTSLQTYVGYTL